jgi:hypothetical protein
MQIIFQCNNCDSRLEIEAESAGEQVECPTCKAWVVVPRKGIEPGTTLGGFRIVRLLGRGGMAEVYLARQLSMDRAVAVKILSQSLASQPAAAEAFIREIRLTAKLQHANLVTAFDAGEDHGVLFMAMAYINGSTLHEAVRRKGAFEQTPAVSIAFKIASALDYAWRDHRLLHRDVKPGNILLDAKGEPHLADLGLAQSLHDSKVARSSGPIGTPNYMSPEQAAGEPVDCRSDIYGLGATLYTAVTGQIPYEANSADKTFRRLQHEAMPDPRLFNPELSPGFVALLGRMLARDPRERYEDWEDTRQALRTLASNAHALMHTPGPRRRAGAEGRSVWARALLGGLAAGAVLGVAAAGWWVRTQRGAGPPEAAPARPETGATNGTSTVVSPAPLTTNETPAAASAGSAAEEEVWAALRYAMEHPEDLEGAYARFQAAASTAPMSEEARTAMAQLEARRRERAARTAATVRGELRERMERLLSEGRADEAVGELRAYTGPFAEETRPEREAWAESIERRSRGQVTLRAVADGAARALLAGRFDDARRMVDAAWTDPAAAPDAEALIALKMLVNAGADMEARLLASFYADIGRDLDLELPGGRFEQVRIESVRHGRVRMRRLLPEGYVTRDVAPAELVAAERLRRLSGSDPASALQRGLTAAAAGDRAGAREEFLLVPEPLRNALLRALDPVPLPPGADPAARGPGLNHGDPRPRRRTP